MRFGLGVLVGLGLGLELGFGKRGACLSDLAQVEFDHGGVGHLVRVTVRVRARARARGGVRARWGRAPACS